MGIIYGKPITLGGDGPLPDIFGTGEDGDLVITSGQTVTLDVPVPHQSVVEKNYKSITIEAGGTLVCSDYNAGLVLRCQGDCNISGTIDQSGKAPKTNPDSTYQYPDELVCGDGGDGGSNTSIAEYPVAGGKGMPGRKYGGGISGGGAGGWNQLSSNRVLPGPGGNADEITIDTPDDQMFLGGASVSGSSSPGLQGTNGGGGSGCGGSDEGDRYPSGAGGTGAGANGASGQIIYYGGPGPGGGAGNYGGGVVLIYVGGNFELSGAINCNGLNGGQPGVNSGRYAASGGGGGGGSIYIVHKGTQTVTGNLEVNGGTGGNAGGIGTTTIKQYEKGMTA